jgi:hypothetical protein
MNLNVSLMVSIFIGFAVFPEYCNAASYTHVTRATQTCNDTGRDLGGKAQLGLAQSKRQLLEADATINDWERKQAEAKKRGDNVQFKVAINMIEFHRSQRDIVVSYRYKQRANFLNYATERYGKSGTKLGELVWEEVEQMISSGNPGDMGYAVCMDYFLNLK